MLLLTLLLLLLLLCFLLELFHSIHIRLRLLLMQNTLVQALLLAMPFLDCIF